MTRSIKGAASAATLALVVGACGHNPMTTASWGTRHSHTERECMARAMYFESNRSSEDGMIAVGSVVMNRLQSGRYPKTVCGVVGQHNQFAQGALSKPVSGRSWALALESADAVLAGRRHSRVASAMHFHTAGHTFPYRNMAYVVAAGGNVFYEKKTPGTFSPIHPNVLVAQAERGPTRPSEAIVLARAEEQDPVIRRPAPTRLAVIEDREAPREMRVPTQRTPIVRREAEDDAPRVRVKPERIRLAHLDDAEMPKALRHRSDAAPSGPIGSMPLAYKPSARPETAKLAARSEMVKAAVTASLRPGTRAEAAKSPVLKPIAPKAAPKPAAGVALPYREAKAKPAAQDAPAKLGWKRGAEPAAGASDKAKKRP